MPFASGYSLREVVLPVGLVAILGVTTILSRPLLPIDETRYITVAWEMHVSGDYLVSHLNGLTYAHKPPLLFWLMNLIWWFTGVSSTAARMVAVILASVSVVLTRRLACQLYPHNQTAIVCAPLIHASCMLWMLFSPLLMFDVLLLVCVQVGVLGILHLAQRKRSWGLLLLAIGVGAGALSKGPVVLVHLLPLALTGPLWCPPLRSQRLAFYFETACGILIGAGIALAWALTSASRGGSAYADELLWGQTAGRVVTSFAHRESWWWYLPLIPLCLLPWVLFGSALLNRSLQREQLDSSDLKLRPRRIAAVWGAGGLTLLSLVSGKQIHYVIPLLPSFALFAGPVIAALPELVVHRIRLLIAVGTIVAGVFPVIVNHGPWAYGNPLAGICPSAFCIPLCLCGIIVGVIRPQDFRATVVQVSSAAVIFISLLNVGLSVRFWPEFDVTPLAQQVRGLEENQVPVAWYGNYHGQLHFAGRLRKPITELMTPEALHEWVRLNPRGRVILPSADEQQAVQVPGLQRETEYRCTIRRGLTTATVAIVQFRSDDSVSLY